MNITILTYGSLGDVHPFIPLSLGLMAKGHFVKLAAPSRFQNLIQRHDIRFVPLAGEPAELSRRLNDSGQNAIKMVRGLMEHAIEIGADVFRQTEEACLDSDLMIHTFMHAVGAHTIAREKNIPDIHVQLFPMYAPTGDYPNVTLPDLKIRALNRSTHEITRLISVWIAKIGFEQVHRRSGLPKRKLYSPFNTDQHRPHTPILCAWSPSVVPPSKDWQSNVHVTGYYFDDLAVTYQPTVEVQRFLDAGEPPVCVSFGSMVNRDFEKIDRIVCESLRKMNLRGIVLSGWSGMKNASSNEIIYLDAVSHQWLLPRCRMIIHHGGAGTTSAGLRAGIPNIVVPFTADQPFWGRRVSAIGAGPRPVHVKKLSEKNLTRAVAEGDGDVVRKQAQVVGHGLRSEDGVGRSLELIEKYIDEFFENHL